MIFGDLGFVSTILSYPVNIFVDKQDSGCRLLSQYFSKVLSLLGYQAYQPIPNFEESFAPGTEINFHHNHVQIAFSRICSIR